MEKEIKSVTIAEPIYEDSEANTKSKDEEVREAVYTMTSDGIFKNKAMIANFKLLICAVINMVDAGVLVRKLYEVNIWIKQKVYFFTIDADVFAKDGFMRVIHEEVGPQAILYGSIKDLKIAVQENIPENLPESVISLCTGFTSDGKKFLLPNMEISSAGVCMSEQPIVDLSASNLASKINHVLLDEKTLRTVVRHIFTDFINLKSYTVMLPVLGHVCLSPFSSLIVGKLGRQKYTLHLKGPSGGGKTFIARLIGEFFGDFGDNMMSWTSTANSIEWEGYHFRDLIFILDDFKASMTSKKDVIRVLQNHADNRGRGRLNTSALPQTTHCIRGLLLSTGEDFISGVESVSGRTIVLSVEPEHNQAAGQACKRNQHLYKGIIPIFIQCIISKSNWVQVFKQNVDKFIEDLSGYLDGISNGLRVATNWAFNAVAFEMFCKFAVQIGAINKEEYMTLLIAYVDYLEQHFKNALNTLKTQDPSEIFWSVMEHKIATEAVIVTNLVELSPDTTKLNSTVLNKKTIGTVSPDGQYVSLFPNSIMEQLNSYFKGIGEKMPFDKPTLRDALVRNDFIIRAGGNRITKQIRHNKGRIQAWQFDIDKFKQQCIEANED